MCCQGMSVIPEITCYCSSTLITHLLALELALVLELVRELELAPVPEPGLGLVLSASRP